MEMKNPIHFDTSALPDDARVIAFRGREALNTPYEIEVWVSTASGDEVDLEDALFAPATLTVDPGDTSPSSRGAQHMRGVIAGVDHVHEYAGRAIFSLLLVPRLWLLGQSEHSRIFTDKSFDQILRTLVDAVGISGDDLDVQVGGLPVEEHVCQYRESDLAFLHRWLEREGLAYYFDHSGDAEKLVVTDAQPSVPMEGGPVRYHPTLGAEAVDFTAGGHFQRLRTQRVAMPRAVKLADYDYAKPKLAVKGEDDVLSRGQVEIVRFGERFFDPDRGAALAKLRGQALRGKQEIQVATGNVLGVRPGSLVEVEQHPRAALNQKYLVLAAEHSGVDPNASRDVLREIIGFDHQDIHRVTAELLATSVEYKPAAKTPWPRIASQELAIIDGPAGSEYAQLDDQGRYKVKFLFDEGDGEAGKASTWVRMMQPHGGNPEGFHFPLRKGTEVVVTFPGGDPDRPLIAGTVPNAETPSPVTSANNTKNVLVTGGRNKLEIEDLDGQQWINWYTPSENTEIHMGYPKPFGKAQANLGEHTDGTASFTFGGDWYVDVGGLHDEHVVGNVLQKYDGTRDQDVGGNVTETYRSNWDTVVTGDRNLTVNGVEGDAFVSGWNQFVGVKWEQIVNGPWIQSITGGWKQSITGGWVQQADQVTQTVTGAFVQTTGPANVTNATHNWEIAGPATWKIGGGITMTTPSATMIGAGWTEIDSHKTHNYGLKEAYGYVNLGYAALKVAVNAVNINIYPVLSVSLIGLKLANRGINVANFGPDLRSAQISVFT